MRRRTDTGLPLSATAVWRAATPLARAVGRWWFPLTYSGSRLPPGPVVIAANHFSHLDPVVVAAAVKRPVRYLAVDELYGNSRVFDTMTIWLGAIPMTRTGVAFGPLKLALAELASGGSIGLFPEGERVWAWGEREAKRGAAWLARRADVPLVPVAVSGSDVAMGRGGGRISRAPIHVEICQPIVPSEFATGVDPIGAMTEEWSAQIGRAIKVR